MSTLSRLSSASMIAVFLTSEIFVKSDECPGHIVLTFQVAILMRRFSSVIILLTTTLCVHGILFIYLNKIKLWMPENVFLTRQAADTGSKKYVDRYVLTTSKDTLSSVKEHESYRDIYNTESVKSGQGKDTVMNEVKDGCNFPDIDPFDPVVMAVTKFYPPITCEGGVPHLVYRNEDTIKVNHSKTALAGDINNRFKECRYKTVAKKPGSDFETVVLYTSLPFNDSITLRDSDDNLVVECYGNNNTVLSRSYFSLIRVKPDLELLLEERFKKHMTLNAPKEVFNILMIGIDGNSKQNFQRHMPKTRNFLLNVLNATELRKYNKLDEHTFVNVVPLLTGKLWFHLNWTVDEYFDSVNDDFLWSDYHKAGYRTGAFFDDSVITAFHFLKKGWDKPPVDYYHRATIIEFERDKLMRHQRYDCVGDIPEITFNHDFWLQMATTFNNSQTRPFFGFSFSAHLTHDSHNIASAGDDLYLRFLQELKDKNVTNNTVIVFFSDHGARYGDIRYNYNGMIESSTPYVFLVFPPWFHEKYPDLMKVLKINQERLTTNKDVYETLRDLLNFQAETRLGNISKRGISLFQEIPRERTCEHAGITLDFCICNNMTQTNVSSGMSVALAEAVQGHLRMLTSQLREKCEELFLQSVQSVIKIQTNNPTNNEAAVDKYAYKVIMTTRPGNAIYEATLSYSNSTKKFKVIGTVIRLNLYRGQADCINDFRLRPFCFCHK